MNFLGENLGVLYFQQGLIDEFGQSLSGVDFCAAATCPWEFLRIASLNAQLPQAKRQHKKWDEF